MKRLSYLVLLVFLGFVATVERTMAQQKESKKIRLNVFRVDAATVAARVNGYFAGDGFEVDVTVTPNSTEQMRGLSQGKFEVVSTAFDNVLAWSGREGAEIITVAQISDKTVLPVFVRPEIKTWSDLKGKKLAADAVDTAFALVLRRILLANGLDMTKGDYARVDDQGRNVRRYSHSAVRHQSARCRHAPHRRFERSFA